MSTEKQYIARISYGKDSLKMLEVIKSRGLPLDRITTTDVWATDTISANLPPMQEFKDRMDQRIWDMYRIQVEHLCALNPDGTKKTYEQMFYHIPKRKNLQSVQVERERERENGPELTLSSQPVHVERERERDGSRPAPSSDSRTSGIRGVKLDSNGMPMHRVQGTITGFPPNSKYSWCQKLKVRFMGQDQGMASLQQISAMVSASQNQDQNTLFRLPAPTGQKKYRGLSRYSRRRACPVRSA